MSMVQCNYPLMDTTWTLVDTFAYSKPSDKHFMVTVNASQVAVIVFGDGTFGSIPSAGQKITSASFYIDYWYSRQCTSRFYCTNSSHSKSFYI